MNETRISSDRDLDADDAPQIQPERARSPGSVLIATDNRTTGAVLCGLLRGRGRSARWIARKDLDVELRATQGAQEDVVLAEVDSQHAIATVIASARNTESVERVAVLALTPESRPDLRAACEREGFDGCLGAPIDPDALLELIEAVLNRNEGDAEEISRDSMGAEEREGAPQRNSIVDRRALDDLAELGGSAFVNDIVAQFVEDASSVLRTLHEAVQARDAAVFRDQAHALRSCAANVGANSVYATCLAWREIQPAELAAQGQAHMKRLEFEFACAREVLQDYLKQS